MILTDEAAFVLLALLAVAVLILAAVAGFGLFLVKRGWRVTGFGLIAAVLAFVFGPNLIDQARNAPVSAAFQTRTNIPDTLDLTGQRVLFIETGGTICAEICRDVLSIGTDVEAYWVGAGGYTPETFTDNPIRDVLDGEAQVVRVHLGPPLENLGNQRYAEVLSEGGAAPYDVVILEDRGGLVAYVAPHLLGAAIPDRVSVQSSILVFTDWPDPFAAPPPEPTYRSVTGRVGARRVLLWPVSNSEITMPPYATIDEGWSAALCPFAGDAAARDAFFYGYLCDADALNTLLD